MSIEDIKDLEEFRTIIHSTRPALVDFYTPSCGQSCNYMEPMFDKLAGETPAEIMGFYKVDTSEAQDIAAEIGAAEVGPNFVLYKDGAQVDAVRSTDSVGLHNMVQRHGTKR